MIKPRYTLRRAGATNTPAQGQALANALRPFFVGPAGPPGNGEVQYTHTQAVASATWTVNHNLGYRPAVSVLSVGGALMLAEVIHISANQAQVFFDSPTAGQAACS
jgi:hypothetical protein